MKRSDNTTKKKKDKGPKKLRWSKVGGSPLRLTNPDRIIKRNQIFYAYEHEIPKAFRDLVLCLDTKEKMKEVAGKLTPPAQKLYVAQPTGSGWFIVANTLTSKVMSESKMRKKEAQELAKELNG